MTTMIYIVNTQKESGNLVNAKLSPLSLMSLVFVKVLICLLGKTGGSARLRVQHPPAIASSLTF